MSIKKIIQQGDKEFEKEFPHSSTCDSNAYAEQNSEICICQIGKIKSFLHARQIALVKEVCNIIENQPTSYRSEAQECVIDFRDSLKAHLLADIKE